MTIVVVLFVVGLVIFFGRAVLQAKARMHFADELAAKRDLGQAPAGSPSWLGTAKEEEFFNGVSKLAYKSAVPVTYVVNGFASPQSSAVIFSLAANMEARGASFAEQQLAAANFVVDAWMELGEDDKAYIAEMERSSR